MDNRRLRQLHHPGFALSDLLIAGGMIFAVVLALQIVVLRHNALQRDFRRLADMREAEVAWQRLYRTAGSYASAAEGGCKDAGSLLETCNFGRIGYSARSLRDPGSGTYRIKTPPTETTFAITFALERSHGQLAAGEHTLTEKGIK